MEIMKKVADKHHMACLLHEKPFEGINGSGKHVNWSMSTDTGENLLEPGKTPAENTQFLVFLLATIAAVDNYADLMRISVASAGNDHRLGANEAPPAVISIFVGDELEQILDAIDKGISPEDAEHTLMNIGAKILPTFMKDTTDRNRTSPFAFTGNKFEFRMPGSSVSVADPIVILNTAVAESLRKIRKTLEGVPEADLRQNIMKLLQEIMNEHKKVIFNGNGYTDEWISEAEKRGLYNLKSLPEAMPSLLAEKNVKLFTQFHIFDKKELEARYEILLENYSKTIHIESLTMLDIVKKDFIPGLLDYMSDVTDEAISKKELSDSLSVGLETDLLSSLSSSSDDIMKSVKKLSDDTKNAEALTDEKTKATDYHDVILSDMDDLRKVVDTAEALIPAAYLDYPTYDQLLFSLR